MALPKVVVSFRFLRHDTTGVHCYAALKEILGDKAVFIDPDMFDTIIDDPGADLLLAIDDDGAWRFPQDWTGKRAVWFIDTHTNLPRRNKRAPAFDFVFCAQNRGAHELREATQHPNVEWLALACNPEVHRKIPRNISDSFDWCFVGHVPRDKWLPMNRAWLIDALVQFKEHCWVGEAYGDDMLTIFCNSKTIFNRSIVDDLNMRVFEACASGTPLITNRVVGQDRLFDEDKHLFIYGDYWGPKNEAEELLICLDRVLSLSEKDRQKVGRNARQHVLRFHTYKHRMREILSRTIDYGTIDDLYWYDRTYEELKLDPAWGLGDYKDAVHRYAEQGV